jgi:hypothetical protein
MKVRVEFLQGYMFHYNPYVQMWSAMKREHVSEYFNGTIKEEDVVKAPDVNTLLEYLKGVNG